MLKSQRDFAKAVGISQATMNRLVQRPDWPVNQRGPWSARDVKAVQHWREGFQEDRSTEAPRGTSGMSGLTGARTIATIERAKSTRLNREILEAKFHDAQVCQQRRIRQIVEVRTRLCSLGRRMQPSLGLTDDQVCGIENEINQIVDWFAR